MKAVSLRHPGGLDRLELVDLEEPRVPRPGEVTVRIRASSINYHDYLVVGEVGDARVDGLRLAAPPVAYFSIDQGGEPAGTIEVRAAGDPANIAVDIRRRLSRRLRMKSNDLVSPA